MMPGSVHAVMPRKSKASTGRMQLQSRSTRLPGVHAIPLWQGKRAWRVCDTNLKTMIAAERWMVMYEATKVRYMTTGATRMKTVPTVGFQLGPVIR